MASRFLLRQAIFFFLALLFSNLQVSVCTSVLNIGGLQFPIEPSANVDQNCMFDCAQKQNYSNVCYWNCGIDPQCQWGTMMQCVDSHPDRQMNCVNKSGCLHFVKTFLKDKKSAQNSQSFLGINLQEDSLPESQTGKSSSTIDEYNYRLYLFLGTGLILTLVCIYFILKRKKSKRSPFTRDYYVLIQHPDVTAQNVGQLL